MKYDDAYLDANEDQKGWYRIKFNYGVESDLPGVKAYAAYMDIPLADVKDGPFKQRFVRELLRHKNGDPWTDRVDIFIFGNPKPDEDGWLNFPFQHLSRIHVVPSSDKRLSPKDFSMPGRNKPRAVLGGMQLHIDK